MLAPSDFSSLKNFVRKPVHENRSEFFQWFKITSNQLTVNDVICDVVFVNNNTAKYLLMNFDCPVDVSSMPAHTARATQNWLQTNCPDFIAKDQWPPNSPDLNPLDYHVWGGMLEAYHKLHPKPKTIAELKEVLQVIWDSLT